MHKNDSLEKRLEVDLEADKTDLMPNVPRPHFVTGPWSDDDRVRWVQRRVAELTIENGKFRENERGELDELGKQGTLLLEGRWPGPFKLFPADSPVSEYAVWLWRYRDKLKWSRIARRLFGNATPATESKVRRMFKLVEKHHSGSPNFETSGIPNEPVLPCFFPHSPRLKGSKRRKGTRSI